MLNCGFILCITIWTPPLEMGTHHYHFRCNMATQMIRPPDRWASLVYPHHCRRPRGTSAGNRTLSAADNRQCQATCQFRWVAYPSSRHRRRRQTFLADGIPGPSVRTSTWGRTDRRQWKLDRTTRATRGAALWPEIRTLAEMLNIARPPHRKHTEQELNKTVCCQLSLVKNSYLLLSAKSYIIISSQPAVSSSPA